MALCALLPAGNINPAPFPVGARARSAEDVNIRALAGDRAVDIAEREACDWDAAGGGAGGRAVLVVLLDDDAVRGDAAEGDVLVGDRGDLAGRFVDGLDADAVGGGGDAAGGDDDIFDGVVAAAADGADGEAVAA